MELLSSYYRNPIFGVLVLLSFVLCIAMFSIIFASVKENKFNKSLKKHFAKAKDNDNLFKNLSDEELKALAYGAFKANLFADCKKVLIKILLKEASNDLLYMLAVCNIRLGLLKDAKDELESILSIAARHKNALKALAYLELKLGDKKAALDCYFSLSQMDEKFLKDFEFIKNYQAKISENKLDVVINGEKLEQKNMRILWLCKKCSSSQIVYFPICPHCFKANSLNRILRINL